MKCTCPFRISYTEAVEILERKNKQFEYPVKVSIAKTKANRVGIVITWYVILVVSNSDESRLKSIQQEQCVLLILWFILLYKLQLPVSN